MAKEEIRDAVYTRRYIYNFHYHLIWVTKYRNKTFVTEQLSNEMKSILQLVADDNDIVIEKMEVMPDHVHVLISFPPSKAPTSAIKVLKGRSAFIFLRRHPEIRQSQYWGGHLWSPRASPWSRPKTAKRCRPFVPPTLPIAPASTT